MAKLRVAGALLLALAAGCGAGDPDATPSQSEDLTSFACSATAVEPGRPRAYFGPFDPLDREALCVLDLAKSEVVVAHYNIRMQSFLDKLVELHDRGVTVKVAVDQDNAKQTWNTGDDYLEQHGIRVVRTKPSGASAAIMHLKVAVVDGEIAMAGSFNWNATATLANDENMVVVRDEELVTRYRNEALEVMGERARVVEGGAVSPTAELHFSPEEKLDAVISKQIAAATKSVDVAMFTLTSQPVADALVAAAKRGVAVRIVTEGKQSATTGVDEKIRAAGALVVEGRNQVGEFSAMHHKYAVVDGGRVLTGASNWTLNGTRQSEEDSIVLALPELAREYEENFADLLHVYAGQEAAEPASERAGVLFHVVQADTRPGDRVVVVGNSPALGAWNPHAGIDMGTSDDLFPSWTARVRLAPGAEVEWKYVTIRASGAVEWEPGANRSLAIPSSGRGTVIEGNYGDTDTSWTPAKKP